MSRLLYLLGFRSMFGGFLTLISIGLVFGFGLGYFLGRRRFRF